MANVEVGRNRSLFAESPGISPALFDDLNDLFSRRLESQSYDQGDLLYAPENDTLGSLELSVTTGALLKANVNTGLPEWSVTLDGAYTITGTLAFDGWGTGSLGYTDANDVWTELAVGSAGQILGVSSSLPAWVTPSTYLAHDLLDGAYHQDTTAGTVAEGDMIIGNGATPLWQRLAAGGGGAILRQNPGAGGGGGAIPGWLALGGANAILQVNAGGTDLSWTSAITDQAVVYSNSGVLTGDATNFFYDGSDLTVKVGIIAGDPGVENSGINVNGTTYESVFKVSDIGGTNLAMSILHRHSTSWQPILLGARSNSDTSSHGTVTNGQTLLSIYAVGWTGSHYDLGAGIDMKVSGSGTISSTSLPTELVFYTSPDGSTALTTALTIDSSQNATFAGSITSQITANIGTTTLAAAQGDFAAGITGSTELLLDASARTLTLNANSGANAEIVVDNQGSGRAVVRLNSQSGTQAALYYETGGTTRASWEMIDSSPDYVRLYDSVAGNVIFQAYLNHEQGFVVNDGGNDINFRVEDTGSQYGLYVDAGNSFTGIGANTGSFNARLGVANTQTGTGSQFGIQNSLTWNPGTSQATGTSWAIFNDSSFQGTHANNTGVIGGMRFDVYQTGSSGTIATMQGTLCNLRVDDGGSVTTGQGFRSAAILSSTGNMTTFQAYLAPNPTTSGTGGITTHVQFLAEDVTAANVTTAIGFQQKGTNAHNRFNGATTIGADSAPTSGYELDVQGDVIVSGYFNGGTTTLAAAQGDFAAGITGSGQLFFDESAATAWIYDSSGNTDIKLNADGDSYFVNDLVVGSNSAPTSGYALDVQGDQIISGELHLDGDLNHDGSNWGMFGTAPTSQQAVAGARNDPEQALANLLTALENYGVIVNNTTAT